MTVITRDYRPSSVQRRDFGSMPDDYQTFVIRLMSVQAHGEKMAATQGVEWTRRLPGFRERRILANVLADEARHSALLYRELESIGIDEVQADEIVLHSGASPTTAKSMEGPIAVGDPENEWIDIVLNMMLLDRAGRHMIENYCESSYKPWADVCHQILPDEAMHEGFGFVQFRKILAETSDRDRLAAKFTRWYAYSLNFFGPPSRHKYDVLRTYGLKRQSNEELRASYQCEVEALMAGIDATDLIRLTSSVYPYA
jgi:ring-1,2-phenylacetyl-CoA epoxidase subunit PaaA